MIDNIIAVLLKIFATMIWNAGVCQFLQIKTTVIPWIRTSHPKLGLAWCAGAPDYVL
jgi:hypothetical protein